MCASKGTVMASRAIIATGRSTPSWRIALRRSLVRAGELGGACALFGLMLFLGLALASYHQTDPSVSTAAGGAVANWMGAPGAWAAERMLFAFGVPSLLILPLVYLEARQLWALSDAADGDAALPSPRWWRLIGMLLLAMALLGTVLALVFDAPGGSLPASLGGVAGLLGAKAITAIAGLVPPVAQGWTIMGLALATLIGGALLAGRVFQLEWRALLRMPAFFRAFQREPGAESTRPLRRERMAAKRAAVEDITSVTPRKPPEIADPRAPPKQAQLTAKSRQTDLFAQYELPSLELLSDPPPQPANKQIGRAHV